MAEDDAPPAADTIDAVCAAAVLLEPPALPELLCAIAAFLCLLMAVDRSVSVSSGAT